MTQKELSPVGKRKPVVRLVAEDGNAFAILGRVKKALLNGGYSKEECQRFVSEATSGDYDHLLFTCFEWAQVR